MLCLMCHEDLVQKKLFIAQFDKFHGVSITVSYGMRMCVYIGLCSAVFKPIPISCLDNAALASSMFLFQEKSQFCSLWRLIIIGRRIDRYQATRTLWKSRSFMLL